MLILSQSDTLYITNIYLFIELLFVCFVHIFCDFLHIIYSIILFTVIYLIKEETAISKFRIYIVIIAILLLIISFFVYLKNSISSHTSHTEVLLGTVVNISVYGEDSKQAVDEAFDIIRDMESKMSINIKDSEVNRINDNAGLAAVKVSYDTFEVVKQSIEYSVISDGGFDITIAPVVELWGIGTENERVPLQNEIDTVLDKVDYRDIELNNPYIKLKYKDMKIDLGAIAKGYTADKIYERLKDMNIDNAVIDIGGNISLIGSKSDKQPYDIGIQDPFKKRGLHFGKILLEDKTIVTSGTYERFFEKNSVKYHHIISPYDGYPIDNSIESVTIVSVDSTAADGLSTALFSMGIETALEAIEGIEETECIIVDSNKNIYLSSGIADFRITNDEFRLAE